MNGTKYVVSGLLFLALFIGQVGTARAWEEKRSAINIGVLARRGVAECLKEWSPTAQYLTEQLPGLAFKIVPLNFREIAPAVENSQVDFVIVNPFLYVELQNLYGVSRMVTLKRLTPQGYTAHFGGSILYGEVFAPAFYKGKGAVLWATGAPLFDGHGNYIGAIESIRDITSQKHIEEERQSALNLLLESQLRLGIAVKAATDPTGSGILEHSYRIIHPDGQMRWLRVTGQTTFSGRQPSDRPLHADGVIQDVTKGKRLDEEQKKLEQQRQQTDADLPRSIGCQAYPPRSV